MADEIHRAEFVDTPLNTTCVVCAQPLRTLWFNGGELDETRCCGHTYRLEHVRIDFVIERDDVPNPPAAPGDT